MSETRINVKTSDRPSYTVPRFVSHSLDVKLVDNTTGSICKNRGCWILEPFGSGVYNHICVAIGDDSDLSALADSLAELVRRNKETPDGAKEENAS